MEALLFGHELLITGTNFAVIVIFVGLALYVSTRSARRSVSWIFSALCLTVATIYLTSLFLISGPEISASISTWLLRFKWVAIAFTPTLFLHLVFFYFPPDWQRYRLWSLLLFYFLSTGLTLAILFTDQIVAGFHLHAAPHIIGPTPGEYMPPMAGLFVIQLIGGMVGLSLSYRMAHSASIRWQTIFLLISTALVLISSLVHWQSILNDNHEVPHELPDALLVLAALFYVTGIVRFGSFVGRPVPHRRLFYMIVATIMGLVTLHGILTFDQLLRDFTSLSYPLVTGILVFALAASLPILKGRITQRLDRWLFQSDRLEYKYVDYLTGVLAPTSDIRQLPIDLLNTLCTVLNVRSGIVAVADDKMPSGTMTVQFVRGTLDLRTGMKLRRPSLPDKESLLVTVLWPDLQIESGWQDLTLFSSLTINSVGQFVLGIGEKCDGTALTASEVSFCARLTRKVEFVAQLVKQPEGQRGYLDVAYLQDQALQRLAAEVVSSAPGASNSSRNGSASLEIRILGPLQVRVNGVLIPEAKWGSEKAKILLVYLLWRSPAWATREELSEILWPERPIEETANVFHVTLHRLRRALQPARGTVGASDYILCERGRYRFNTGTHYWLDVNSFESSVTELEDPIALQSAVDLYRGPYLEDQAWTLPPDVEIQRRRLEEMYITALRWLASSTNGRQAQIYLEKLLLVEPIDETVHRALVLGYLQRSRPDLARQQLTRLENALTELDLEPSSEVKELWQMVAVRNGH